MSWLPDWITGFDADNAARAAAADAELRRLNQAKRDAGIYDDAQWAAITEDYAGQLPFDPNAQRQDIQVTFTTAATDNAKRIRDGFKNLVNGAVWEALKTIPVSVWIIAAIALFFWLGGAKLLKGSLAK